MTTPQRDRHRQRAPAAPTGDATRSPAPAPQLGTPEQRRQMMLQRAGGNQAVLGALPELRTQGGGDNDFRQVRRRVHGEVLEDNYKDIIHRALMDLRDGLNVRQKATEQALTMLGTWLTGKRYSKTQDKSVIGAAIDLVVKELFNQGLSRLADVLPGASTLKVLYGLMKGVEDALKKKADASEEVLIEHMFADMVAEAFKDFAAKVAELRYEPLETEYARLKNLARRACRQEPHYKPGPSGADDDVVPKSDAEVAAECEETVSGTDSGVIHGPHATFLNRLSREAKAYRDSMPKSVDGTLLGIVSKLIRRSEGEDADPGAGIRQSGTLYLGTIEFYVHATGQPPYQGQWEVKRAPTEAQLETPLKDKLVKALNHYLGKGKTVDDFDINKSIDVVVDLPLASWKLRSDYEGNVQFHRLSKPHHVEPKPGTGEFSGPKHYEPTFSARDILERAAKELAKGQAAAAIRGIKTITPA